MRLQKNSLSYYLFARPSFLGGLARLFDLGSFLQEYNYRKIPFEADAVAIGNDWKMIGEDIELR